MVLENYDNGEINEGLLSQNLDTLNSENLPPYELRSRTNSYATHGKLCNRCLTENNRN